MMKPVSVAAAEESAAEIVGREEHIAPAPRVSVQAFCETVETAAAIQAAGEDRRLSKAHLRIQMGGLTAAIEAYQSSPTPNVIILETESRSDDILGGLDQLAEVCDAGTRVVIIGRMNDVTLYRELVRRGVSERATALGWYPSSATLARTRARVAWPMSSRLFRTFETVVIDTPSSPAIRFMVVVGGMSSDALPLK